VLGRTELEVDRGGQCRAQLSWVHNDALRQRLGVRAALGSLVRSKLPEYAEQSRHLPIGCRGNTMAALNFVKEDHMFRVDRLIVT